MDAPWYESDNATEVADGLVYAILAIPQAHADGCSQIECEHGYCPCGQFYDSHTC